MSDYKTVKSDAESTFVVERSKFISHIKRVESREQAEEFINEIKKEYWDARHNVYAYALKTGESRCTDDGEPSGTAGMPTLDVILKQGYSDVVIVTTRYFGGILLGTGGLVRAYSKSAALALEEAGSVEVCECAVFHAEAEYSLAESFERYLKDNNCVIINKEYAQNVTFDYCIRLAQKDEISQKITNHFSARLKPEFIKISYEEL